MVGGDWIRSQTHGRQKKTKHQVHLSDMEPISKKQNNRENIDMEKTYRKALKAEKKKEETKHATLLKEKKKEETKHDTILKETNHTESQIGKSKGQECTKKKKSKVRRKEEVTDYKDEAENDKNVETRRLQSHINQAIEESSKKKEDKRKEEVTERTHKEEKAEKKEKGIQSEQAQEEEKHKKKKKNGKEEEVFVEYKQKDKRKKEEFDKSTEVELQEVENRKTKKKKKKKAKVKAEDGEHQTTKQKKKKHKEKKQSSELEETIFCHSTEIKCTKMKKKKKKKKKKKTKDVDKDVLVYQAFTSNNTDKDSEETGKKKKRKLTETINGDTDKAINIIIDLTSHEEEQTSIEEKTKVKKQKKSKNVPAHQKHKSNKATVEETQKKKNKKSTKSTNVIEKGEANNIIDLTSLDSKEKQNSMIEKTELKKQKKSKKNKSICENEKETIKSPVKTTKAQEYQPEKMKKRKLLDCEGNISDSQHKKKKKRKNSDGYGLDDVTQKKKKTKSAESDENNMNVDSQLKKKKKSKQSSQSNSFSYDTHHESIDSAIISSSAEHEETDEERTTQEHYNISSDNDEDVNSEESMFKKYLSYEEQAKRRDRYGRLLTNTVIPAGRKDNTSSYPHIVISPRDEDTSLHQHIVISPRDEVKFDDLSTCCDYVKSMPWQNSPNAEKLHKLPYKSLSKADIEKLAKEGITVKRGRWLREEEHRLQMNFKAFLEAHKTLLLEIDSNDLLVYRQELYTGDINKWQLIQDVRKKHNFVTSLSLGLERDVFAVMWKAKDILHTSKDKGHFTAEEDKHIQDFINKQGGSSTLSAVAAVIGRTPLQVSQRIRHLLKSVNKGKWTEAECQTLRQAVKQVHEESGRDPMHSGSRFPWSKVAQLIASRNVFQCRDKWRRIGHLGINEECNRKINARLNVALVEYMNNLVSNMTKALDDRAIDWTQMAKEVGFPNRELCHHAWRKAKSYVAPHQEDISVQGVLEKLGPLTQTWRKKAGLHELITIPSNKELISEPWHSNALHQVMI